MELFDLTLDTPAKNLALDEALLDEAEASAEPREMLRLWEADRPFVVVGRNSRLDDEVRVEVCRRRRMPIFRRTSGGCAIVAGPGCLMYAVVLSYEVRPHLRMVDEAHRFVLGTIAAALRPVAADVRHRGTSDLALGDVKFSGNSMRCRRRSFLYHGTLLYDFSLDLIADCLKMPPRQPEYRQDRAHRAFVGNLPLRVEVIRRALVDAWDARPTDWECPRKAVGALVASAYRPLA